MKTFGAILKQKRKAKGWTQTDLAEKLNTTTKLVWSWEHDQCVPRFYTVVDIADLFDCSLDDFVDQEGG